MILLSSALGSFIQLLGVLIIFLFVLAITYFTTKWIGNYQKTNFANKNLQIVESIRVGNNKFIAIVKAGEVYLVVAVGKDDVTLLTAAYRRTIKRSTGSLCGTKQISDGWEGCTGEFP